MTPAERELIAPNVTVFEDAHDARKALGRLHVYRAQPRRVAEFLECWQRMFYGVRK